MRARPKNVRIQLSHPCLCSSTAKRLPTKFWASFGPRRRVKTSAFCARTTRVCETKKRKFRPGPKFCTSCKNKMHLCLCGSRYDHILCLLQQLSRPDTKGFSPHPWKVTKKLLGVSSVVANPDKMQEGLSGRRWRLESFATVTGNNWISC